MHYTSIMQGVIGIILIISGLAGLLVGLWAILQRHSLNLLSRNWNLFVFLIFIVALGVMFSI